MYIIITILSFIICIISIINAVSIIFLLKNQNKESDIDTFFNSHNNETIVLDDNGNVWKFGNYNDEQSKIPNSNETILLDNNNKFWIFKNK